MPLPAHPARAECCRTCAAADLPVAGRQVEYCPRMSASKVFAVAAAYYVLFGALVQQSHIRRRRAVARSSARPRTRHSFDELQDSLSRAEFARKFRMSLEIYANLHSHLKLNVTRDMRMASRSSGGRVRA
jgi:hypothetical protein